MHSTLLMLILDDVELGIGLTKLSILSFQLGEAAVGRQYQLDAEHCRDRAERFAARLSTQEERRSAALSLKAFDREIGVDSGLPFAAMRDVPQLTVLSR